MPECDIIYVRRDDRHKYELVSSEMLMFEVTQCPIEQRRDMIREYIELNSSVHVGPSSSEKLREMEGEL